VTTASRLVVLRHGVTTSPQLCAGQRADPPLAPEGREQLREAIARLALDPDAVVAAPSRRARDSAALLGLPVRLDARLAERDWGVWEGRRWEEVWSSVLDAVRADGAAYAAFTPPGGEPLSQVAARCWAAALELTAEPGRTVLAVTSAGPLRVVVGAALGLPAARLFALDAEHGRAAILSRRGRAWILDRLGA
jgi:alpha-ribazole phosphatase